MVDENASAGTVVATLGGVDEDSGDSLSYSISDPSGNFEVVGNEIRVKPGASIDFEDAQTHDVTVTVTDLEGLTYDETVTLNVGDINEAPGSISLDNSSVDENSSGVVVGTLTTADEDAGDTVTYSVDDAPFEVVDGQLTLKDGISLDHEAEPTLNVTVTATDSGGLQTSQSFDLNTTNVNEAPVALELTADATSVVREINIENSGFEDRSYGDQGYGSGAPGWQTTGSSGDWNPTERSLQAEASEGDNVAYANNGGSLVQTVDESFSADFQYVLTVDVGNRQDIGGHGNYEIQLYAGDQLVGTIDGGAPEEGGWSTVTLTVDGSSFPEEFSGFGKNLRIALVNEQGGPVNFDNVRLGVSEPSESLSVDENQPGAVVAVLPSTDEDAGDSVTYTVSDDRFEVVGSQLKLKEGVSLDNEDEARVNVTVAATDSGGLETAQSFTLTVNDVNEAPTEVTVKGGSVDENSAAGTVVATLAGLMVIRAIA